MERWTIITEDGLLMWREDLFSEDEAKRHVAEHPCTADGTPQLAVTTSEARAAQQIWREVGKRLEEQKTNERIEKVREMLVRS